MLYADDLNSVSWRCVHFANSSDITRALSEISQLPFSIIKADLKNVRTEQNLFDEISSALKFPDYFGANWDALNDCLYDMEWMPSKGYLLILEGAKETWSNAPEATGQFVSAWQTAAQLWGEKEEVPFHLIFSF